MISIMNDEENVEKSICQHPTGNFFMLINMFVILLLIRLSLKLSSNLDNSQMWKKKK